MIDPLTGLELKTITPYPKYEGQPIGGTPNPVAEMPNVTAPVASTQEAVAISPTPQGGPAKPVGGLKPSNLLDKVLFTMFGTPDSMLDDEEHAKKHQRRKGASADATRSANDPGSAEMEIPTAGGGSLGESFAPILQGIASLFMGGK